jgi:hypothetical protein
MARWHDGTKAPRRSDAGVAGGRGVRDVIAGEACSIADLQSAPYSTGSLHK